jgi:hypothetical protein
MTKLIRNTADKESRDFWQAVDRIADSVKDAPAWQKAGIALNPRNFETYAADVNRPRDEPSDK